MVANNDELMPNSNTASYLNWQSSISAEQVFLNDQQYRYPSIRKGQLYYLGTSSDSLSRNVLMRQGVNNPDEPATCVTSSKFNLRTRISEYGGKPYWLGKHAIYFVNDSDQRLYRQDYSNESCQPVSPAASNQEQVCFADIIELSKDTLLAIAEFSRQGQDNEHCLVLVDFNDLERLTVLHQGADFYSNLITNNSRTKVAWVQWQHPSMPWDDCQLIVADIAAPSNSKAQWVIRNCETVAFAHRVDTSPVVSICQCLFVDEQRLLCVADYQNSDEDWQGYWNIHQVYISDKQQLSAQPVTRLLQEFGYPHWQYGDARLALLDDNTVMAFATDAEHDRLYRLDLSTLQLQEVAHDYLHFQSIASDIDSGSDNKGNAVMLALSGANMTTMVLYRADEDLSECVPAEALPIANDEVSLGRHLKFPTRDGQHAYAYYYAPQNSQYGNAKEMPPLLVMVHGGPTARAYGHFDLVKQFWTNRGFAVLDVNHRGSVGYGRVYRDALYQRWGELDCTDIIDAIEYLVSQELADQNRVCIRGKSAGGYAVLCALTKYPEHFAAGASYYGIGNLVTLAQLTHKFEAHYTDRLIGEVFNTKNIANQSSLFNVRSPINHLQGLHSAMAIFQGSLDKVVPPALAHELVAVLKEQGVHYQYQEYPNEAHGFKQLTNNVDALSKELAFYREVFQSD